MLWDVVAQGPSKSPPTKSVCGFFPRAMFIRSKQIVMWGYGLVRENRR